MLYQGEEIKKLIPQRDPIMMVDAFIGAESDEARTGLKVLESNFFCENGRLAEPGIIEHIAQSASAFAGYKALCQGLPVPIGYIGEVKKCHIYRLPMIGDELRTTITMGPEVNGVTILTGVTRVGEEVIADTSMKIFVEE